MRPIFKKYSYFFFLAGLFILSELIVNPVGDYPLNDDWTYGKSTLIFKNEGIITVGDFAAMTLFTHILWGFLFTKIFWFSFTILRLSTLISSLIGLFTLYKLVAANTKNQVVALFACLALLYNPLYFNLSNTYMTDVNFNTLLILCCYFAADYFNTKNRLSFVMVFVMSALLVLVRQFGIIVPACFTFACLFVSERRWLTVIFSVLLLAGVYAIFKYYEHYLKGILPEGAAYKFSGNVKITSSTFWEMFKYNWEMRYKQILLNVILYTAPFSVIFLRQILQHSRLIITLPVALLSFLTVFYGFGETQFPIGNVFTNMGLGTETFYESLHPEFKTPVEHTYSASFAVTMTYVKLCFMTLTLTLGLLAFITMIRLRVNPLKGRPALIFLLCVFFAYTFMILITESYFDRYHIPVITLGIIIFSYAGIRYRPDWRFTLPLLLIFFYISVFGTKDYLELNRNRWAAYNYVKEKEKVTVDVINGGFEVNCWNDGQHSWWYDFFSLHNYNYLIQYRQDSGFKMYKPYEFQRYFPYKKDTIFIFEREKQE